MAQQIGPMDLIAAIRIYVRVAESGSFSAIAREVGATQPAVSRQVSALEEHLGARLIQRTTRSLTLTEEGRAFLDHARRVLDCVAEAEAAVGRGHAVIGGLVRLAAPASFGRLYVAPLMRRLLDRHPDLLVELQMSDTTSDLIAGGIDVAIRAGQVSDANLVARRIGASPRQVFASADYLARNGSPLHPADLARHACVIFLQLASPHVWQFDGPDGAMSVQVEGRFRTDSSEAVREAVLGGLGLSLSPSWIFGDDVATGRVQPVLGSYRAGQVPIHAVYPTRRHLAQRTRAVIDFLAEEFRLDPAISSYGAA